MNAKNTPSVRLEELGKTLNRSGLKLTAQRLAVHRAMLHLGHASADQVAARIREKENVRVTSASVYNILLCFAGLGIYGRRPSTDNKMYFDANPTSHIHLYDTQNQVFMEPGDDGALEEMLRKLEGRRFKGYRIEGVDLQILCRPRTRRRTLK